MIDYECDYDDDDDDDGGGGGGGGGDGSRGDTQGVKKIN